MRKLLIGIIILCLLVPSVVSVSVKNSTIINNGKTLYVGEDNLFPIANFTWEPKHPEMGEPILFNASKSYDVDGYITLYEWDWDNDGIFDENHTGPLATHKWYDEGEFPVTLRVTDNDGLTDIKIRYVRVFFKWFWPPTISGPTCGTVDVEYDYEFIQENYEGIPISYFIDWGDNTTTGWTDYYLSGMKIIRNHIWYEKGVYIIRAKVKDIYGRVSDWGGYKVTITRNKATYNSFFFQFLERFPLLKQMFSIYLD